MHVKGIIEKFNNHSVMSMLYQVPNPTPATPQKGFEVMFLINLLYFSIDLLLTSSNLSYLIMMQTFAVVSSTLILTPLKIEGQDPNGSLTTYLRDFVIISEEL